MGKALAGVGEEAAIPAVEVPPDVDGLVGAEPAGTTLDVLRAQAALRRRTELRRAVRDALEDISDVPSTPDVRALREVAARLDAMHPTQASRWLAHPAAALDIGSDDGFDILDSRTPRQRAVATARHVTATADQHRTLILGPGSLPFGELYLPRLHATVVTDGAVVAFTDDGATWRATWEDGFTLTLPIDADEPLPAEMPGMRRGGWAREIPVLNVSLEFTHALREFSLLQGPAVASATAGLREGLDVLADVWPEARDVVGRVAEGLVVLAARGHARSHSPRELAGCVLLTVDHPYTVADLLCHETAHLRLQSFLALDPLLEDDPERYPSPWRDDPRPLIGLVLGVHAFLDVVTFYRRLAERCGGGDAAQAQVIAERQSLKVRTAWQLVTATARPTDLGSKVLEALDAAVASL